MHFSLSATTRHLFIADFIHKLELRWGKNQWRWLLWRCISCIIPPAVDDQRQREVEGRPAQRHTDKGKRQKKRYLQTCFQNVLPKATPSLSREFSSQRHWGCGCGTGRRWVRQDASDRRQAHRCALFLNEWRRWSAPAESSLRVHPKRACPRLCGITAAMATYTDTKGQTTSSCAGGRGPTAEQPKGCSHCTHTEKRGKTEKQERWE